MRIAVLGGGPAGGSAALALARAGACVDLYLPARPGEKPCGGAVPEHVLPRLAGFDPSPLPSIVSPAAVLENARGGQVSLDLHGLRIFRRRDLDPALAEAAVAAGAVRRSAKAERLEGDSEGVRVVSAGETRVYDWVVGADGARGLSRRWLGLKPMGDSLGLGGSLSGIDRHRLVLGFPGLGDSYAWIFPRPGGASVGIAYTPGQVRDAAARAALDTLPRSASAEGMAGSSRAALPLSDPRFRPLDAGQRAPWARPPHPPGGRRRGPGRPPDARGDPLRHALRPLGRREPALDEGRPEGYPERLASELGEEMEKAHLARDLFFEGSVGQWMVPAARVHPGIRRVLADLLACRQGYTGLKRRLVREAVGLARSTSPQPLS